MLDLRIPPGAAFDRHQVKLPTLTCFRVKEKVFFRCGKDICLLAQRDGFFRIGKRMGSTRPDLDKDQQIILPGDDIDLAMGGMDIALDDLMPFLLKVFCSDVLPPATNNLPV